MQRASNGRKGKNRDTLWAIYLITAIFLASLGSNRAVCDESAAIPLVNQVHATMWGTQDSLYTGVIEKVDV